MLELDRDRDQRERGPFAARADRVAERLTRPRAGGAEPAAVRGLRGHVARLQHRETAGAQEEARAGGHCEAPRQPHHGRGPLLDAGLPDGDALLLGGAAAVRPHRGPQPGGVRDHPLRAQVLNSGQDLGVVQEVREREESAFRHVLLHPLRVRGGRGVPGLRGVRRAAPDGERRSGAQPNPRGVQEGPWRGAGRRACVGVQEDHRGSAGDPAVLRRGRAP
mmetsp:Transcript_3857/g.8259  ORF Transcript_3857/g.8259 Transcript_3857/m.8259 type:complete len:220 (+) Transcript_3857:1313-1972(+)